MFGKKSKSSELAPAEIARSIEQEKLRQMGPVPYQVPAPPVLTFLVVLKQGMEPMKVKASRHTFGQVDGNISIRRGSCDSKTTERYTHFIVDGPTTYVERLDYDFRDGPRYRWVPQVSSDLVFSIRTEEVVMVAEEGHCGEPDVPTQS